MSTQVRRNDTLLLVGLGLVAIGIVALADQLIGASNADLKDAVVFAGLAALLLVATIGTRSYGLLIGAMAFAGLSAAKYAVTSGEDSGGAVLLGPGVGLIAAYAIGTLAFGRRHWWPLVPGAIMSLLGGLLVFGGETGARLAGTIWPIVLIGLGVLVLAGASAVRHSQAPHQRSHP